MSTPRGLRNNNPGNIRKNGQIFQGEKVPATDNEFKQFKTMAYGYRAVFVVLNTYISKGFNTITKIISRWAPTNENNTAGYINKVVTRTGIHKDKVINQNSDDELIKIVSAISHVENGVPANMNDIYAGFELLKKKT